MIERVVIGASSKQSLRVALKNYLSTHKVKILTIEDATDSVRNDDEDFLVFQKVIYHVKNKKAKENL